MKKIFILALLLTLAISAFALTPDYEKMGDKLYNQRNSTTITAEALATIDSAIGSYQNAMNLRPSDTLIYKYSKAIDFKYSILGAENPEAQMKAYQDTLAMIDKYCTGNTTNCAASVEINYSRMVMWGRFGELLNPLAAAKEGIAGNIKEFGEKICNSDKSFREYACCLALGRLHCKAPNILFILSWPDKNESKKYLEEYLKANPESLMGKFFLADTLWELDGKEKATVLYKEVLAAKPAKENYFEDSKAQKDCAARAAELGIK